MEGGSVAFSVEGQRLLPAVTVSHGKEKLQNFHRKSSDYSRTVIRLLCSFTSSVRSKKCHFFLFFFFSSKATFPRAASELRGGNNRSGTWSKASAAAGSKHFYGYFNVFWRVRHESPLFNPAGGRSLILFIPLTSLNILGRRAGSVQCEQIHL